MEIKTKFELGQEVWHMKSDEMITSEIKINGTLIGHIYCVNMGERNKKLETKYKV